MLVVVRVVAGRRRRRALLGVWSWRGGGRFRVVFVRGDYRPRVVKLLTSVPLCVIIVLSVRRVAPDFVSTRLNLLLTTLWTRMQPLNCSFPEPLAGGPSAIRRRLALVFGPRLQQFRDSARLQVVRATGRQFENRR